jgi:hypothetical protein
VQTFILISLSLFLIGFGCCTINCCSECCSFVCVINDAAIAGKTAQILTFGH